MLTGKMTMISLQVPLAMPQRVKLEAHDVILDFIRSRPPLKPVSFWGKIMPAPNKWGLLRASFQTGELLRKIMPAPNRLRFIEGLLSNRWALLLRKDYVWSKIVAQLGNLCHCSLGLCLHWFPYPDNKEIYYSYLLFIALHFARVYSQIKCGKSLRVWKSKLH